MNKYRVHQTISIFVEAENEVEAKEKALTDDNLDGWNKWDIEECDDIIDFYPPLNKDVKIEAIQIKFECEQFKQKMMELNPNVMVDFTVFDINEHLRDMEGNNGNQSK